MAIQYHSKIAGYTDKTSFSRTEKIPVRVSSEFPMIGVSIIDVLTKEEVHNTQSPALKQAIGELAFAEGCNWDETFSIDASIFQPGIYAIRLFCGDEEFHLPIIVKNDGKPSDIMVVVNTNTWCAYDFALTGGGFYNNQLDNRNKYAERTRYNIDACAASSFSKPDLVTSNQIRQFLAGESRTTSHLFFGETYVWKWLKNNHYSFDFVSDLDLVDKHTFNDRKLILLNCHPEYWSHQMYYNLWDCMHHTDTNLLYLGGNAIWRKIILNQEKNRIEKIGFPWNKVQNIFSNSFSEDKFAKDNPIETHPYEILGMFYDDRGYNTYEIFECLNDDHFLTKGTGLRKGGDMGENYDISGPSGHETDKVKHWHVSKNVKYKNECLIARGKNPNSGGADIFYHEIGNSKILSAGSITFGRCIDDPKISKTINNFIKLS